MLRLLVKNLFRNKRRTLLTASSVAVSLFLLSSLAMVYTALGAPLQSADATPIIVIRRAIGITYPMPASYGARIKTVPGVAACSSLSWFGGYWVDPANQFTQYAVDADSIFAVEAASTIPPGQMEAFQRERTAAVAGRRLIEKYHWKIGDRITLLGSFRGVKPELTLRGIFTGAPDDQLWFHWEYLNEALGRPNLVDMYFARVERREIVTLVGQAIDQMFRNSDAETKTESLNAFLLGFVTMLGNVRGIILIVGSAVAFAVLLIVANTMAMSVRERTAEAAVMRALGFRPLQILGLFVGESLLLSTAGALAGVGGAKFLYDAAALSKIGFAFADMRMRPGTAAFCFSMALLIGVLASGWPAYQAARTNVAQALRYTG